jgi:hypothetical protein
MKKKTTKRKQRKPYKPLTYKDIKELENIILKIERDADPLNDAFSRQEWITKEYEFPILTEEELKASNNPETRSLLAHEPCNKNEIRDIFIKNPSSLVIITPKQIFSRRLFFQQ